MINDLLAATHTVVSAGFDRRADAVVGRLAQTPAQDEGTVRDFVVQVFIVAVAILLALGMTLAAGIAVYCISKGYKKVAWYGPNGWKVWQMKVACSK